jgi:hypothetical protein
VNNKSTIRGFFIELFVKTTGGNDKDKGDVTQTRNEEAQGQSTSLVPYPLQMALATSDT